MPRTRLESRIAALRGQVRLLLAVHGVAVLALGLIVAVLFCGAADWLIHLDGVIRLALLIGTGALGLWLAVRYIIGPLMVRFSDLAIALRIERRWPGLNDRLASTIQFLQEDGSNDPSRSADSDALKKATIEQTLAETESIDFREAIDWRPIRRAWAGLFAAIAMAAVVVVFAPQTAAIAWARLVRPFGSDAWPKQTHLIVRDFDEILARGMSFALNVGLDPGDRMPDAATITYRFADGETASEKMQRDPVLLEFVTRIEAVSRPFEFSVAAGDDQTDWQRVEVVPPPSLSELSVTITPPDYIGAPPERQALGEGRIRAPIGSVLAISGRANKPLQSATLLLGGETSEPIAMTLDNESLSARLDEFQPQESTSFQVSAVDLNGFVSPEGSRFEIRLYPDAPPRVQLRQPRADRDVPADAVIPIEITAQDDHGLQVLQLVSRRIGLSASSETEPPQIKPLWAAETADEPGTGTPRLTQAALYRWNLADLDLQPGDVLALTAEARDFDNLRGPNVGRSREVRIRIATPEEIRDQFDERRRRIREQAERIADLQRRAIEPVAQARRDLEQDGDLDDDQVDSLRNAELTQEQVTERLTNDVDGLQNEVARFLDDMSDFQLDDQAMRDQMERMQAGLDRIAERNLDPAIQGLDRSNKSLDNAQAQARARAADPSDPSDPQADTGQRADPSESDNTNADASVDDGNRPTDPQSNDPQTEVGDPKAAGAEAETAPGSESESEAEPGSESEAAEASEGGSPEGASEPGDTASPSRPRGPSMSERDREVVQEGLQEAEENQQAIADQLREILDELSEFESMQELVEDAKQLQESQESLAKRTEDLASRVEVGQEFDQLEAEQRGELANQAAEQEQIAQDLQRLQERLGEMADRIGQEDENAGEALRDAVQRSRQNNTAGDMREAAEELGQNRLGNARQNQEQARRELQDLVDAIENRRENELARLSQELDEAQRDIEDFMQRQADLLEQTRQAKQIADPQEREERLQQLAKEQEQLQQELDERLQRLEKLSPSAAQSGQQAGGQMQQSRGNLERNRGEQAEEDQKNALRNLNRARRQIQQQQEQTDEQLLNERIVKIRERVASLIGRQSGIEQETKNYDRLRTEREGRLTPGQKVGVLDLGDTQLGIRDESVDLIDQVKVAPAYKLVLQRASQRMERAAEGLEELRTDRNVQQQTVQARRRLEQLLDVMQPDGGGQQGSGGQQGGGQGGGGGSGGGDDSITLIGQLKMLKLLQEEINLRTEELDTIRDQDGGLDEQQQVEFDQLKKDQGTIGDLMRDLVQPRSEF